MGDLVPADLRLAEGQVQLDQSSLTGESLPVEAAPGAGSYSGSVVTRGEATGEVTATGARTHFGKTAELVRGARIVSHLEAEEAAAMDMLASDKTGTITENRLTLAALKPTNGIAENDLLRFAALACDEATQDPIDLAILTAARERKLLQDPPRRIRFTPFDPQTRRSETLFEENGATRRAIKGAALEVAALAGTPNVAAEVEALAIACWAWPSVTKPRYNSRASSPCKTRRARIQQRWWRACASLGCAW